MGCSDFDTGQIISTGCLQESQFFGGVCVFVVQTDADLIIFGTLLYANVTK